MLAAALQFRGSRTMEDGLPTEDYDNGDMWYILLPHKQFPAIALTAKGWQVVTLEDETYKLYGVTDEELAEIRDGEDKVSKWLEEQQKKL